MENKFKKSNELYKIANDVYAPTGQIYFFDLVIDSGEGSIIYDIDGNEYIDLLSAASSTNVGHKNPKVVEAIKTQAEKLIHYIPGYFHNELIIDVSKKLIDITPGDFSKKVLFSNSGSAANDAIIKFSRAYTGKKIVLSFTGSYHGTTYGSMSLSAVSLNMRRKMNPIVPEVEYIKFPNLYEKYDNETEKEFVDRYWGYFTDMLKTHIPVDDIAGIIIEPIQADGGFLKTPVEYMNRLYEFTRKNNIVFSVDEINQGLARSGKMWSIDHYNIKPDILTTAKSLASGMPLSAIVGKSEIMDSLEAPAHVFTTAGNPICLAASKATIEVIEDENLVERSRDLGEYAKEKFNKLKDKHKVIGDVRIFGLNGGIELVKSRESKEPDYESAGKLITYLKENGVLMITVNGNVLRFQPPLIISKHELNKSFDIIEEGFRLLEKGSLNIDIDKKIGW